MHYVIFLLYTVAACYMISKTAVIRRSGLQISVWISFFCCKVAAGCVYGYWYSRPERIKGSDTWRFHSDALLEYQLMYKDPREYFSNLFQNPRGSGLFSSVGYWNNLKDNLMLKMISLMDIFSLGNYYVNVVIYSFITFFGFVFYFLACKNVLHRTPSAITTIIILFSPSCLFWTSGIHRDGMVLLFLGIFFWSCTKRAPQQKTARGIIIPGMSLAGVFTFRNYLLILLTPFLAAFIVTKKYILSPALAYLATAILSGLLFFTLAEVLPGINLPKALVDRKQAFDQLEGNSRLPFIDLAPGFKSFALNAPRAVNHAIMRPFLGEARAPMEVIAALELLVVYMIILLSFLRRQSDIHEDACRFQWLIVCYAASVLLLIGYTIPFVGAIVRYRAIFLMLITSTLSFKIAGTYKNYS